MPPGGEPQIVPEAKYRPGKCLASGNTEGPFIDCGRWTREHDPYVQLSVRWVEEQAQKLLGMVSKAEIDERYADLERQLAEQAERIEELERFEHAVAEFAEAEQAINARREAERDEHRDAGRVEREDGMPRASLETARELAI